MVFVGAAEAQGGSVCEARERQIVSGTARSGRNNADAEYLSRRTKKNNSAVRLGCVFI